MLKIAYWHRAFGTHMRDHNRAPLLSSMHLLGPGCHIKEVRVVERLTFFKLFDFVDLYLWLREAVFRLTFEFDQSRLFEVILDLRGV